ncbi:MAG: peptidylprolyl isomerase, partial [Muribaculaceae bacterium]|nr:peptidylprolyl isomerase [Muribaculaceae bacterium]
TINFEMSQLPHEIARVVGNLQPGEISAPFIMRDPRRDREIVAIAKLTARIPAHRANLADDYQLIKNMCEDAGREKIIREWLSNKIQSTYVRIEDGWRGCDFQYDGWIKSK